MTRCPDCALLESRVSELERKLDELATKETVCERCRNEDPVLRRCRNCERTLCMVCLDTDTCAHHQQSRHEFP